MISGDQTAIEFTEALWLLGRAWDALAGGNGSGGLRVTRQSINSFRASWTSGIDGPCAYGSTFVKACVRLYERLEKDVREWEKAAVDDDLAPVLEAALAHAKKDR